MKDKHWAIFALQDIRDALDSEDYEDASEQISGAIRSILSRDDQEQNCFADVVKNDELPAFSKIRHRHPV